VNFDYYFLARDATQSAVFCPSVRLVTDEVNSYSYSIQHDIVRIPL